MIDNEVVSNIPTENANDGREGVEQVVSDVAGQASTLYMDVVYIIIQAAFSYTILQSYNSTVAMGQEPPFSQHTTYFCGKLSSGLLFLIFDAELSLILKLAG